MMNAKELRIGNYAFGRNCKGELVIDQVDWIQDEDHAKGRFQIVEGIPLSENVLLACGFEKDEKNNRLVLSEIEFPMDVIFKNGKICLFESNEFADSTYFINHILYLHELQNFCFSINGEELPIDLTKLQEK